MNPMRLILLLLLADATTRALAVEPAQDGNGYAGIAQPFLEEHCVSCHGPKGLGDGPDVDKKDRSNRPANLAMSRNPEGVVFYKIWNGRGEPKMTAFKSRMTKDEAWAVVAYVTSSLRSQPAAAP